MRLARWRPLAMALTLAASGAAACGCGFPRSGAVSETGPCAQVIPLAHPHVTKTARLVSVRAFKRGQLRSLIASLDKQEPSSFRQARRERHTRRLPRKGCVLVYRGSFKPHGAIAGASAGRYLVLVIGVRHPRLLRGIVVDRLPPVIAKEA